MDWLIELFLWGFSIGAVLTASARFWRGYQRWRLIEGFEPRCRKCGYIICPGVSGICPECGSVLRSTGVTSPDLEDRPIYPFGWVIGTGVMLAPLGLFASFMLSDWFPHFYSEYSATISIATRIPSSQPGNPSAVIEVSASGEQTLLHQLPQSLDVTWWEYRKGYMRYSVETHTMRSGRWSISTGPLDDNKIVADFDQTTALQFVQLAGLNPNSESAQKLAQETISSVQRLKRGDLPLWQIYIDHDGNRTWAMQYSGDSFARYLVLAFLFWLPLWWTVTRILRSEYRRRFNEVIALELRKLDELHISA